MAAHARLKNEYTEDEKCHNLMSWLNYHFPVVVQYSKWAIPTCNLSSCQVDRYEPRYDKTNKMSVCPASTQSNQSSLSTWKKLGSLATHWAHSEGSDSADAQPDLSLRWAHTHFVGFVMSWLILFQVYILTISETIKIGILKKKKKNGYTKKLL